MYRCVSWSLGLDVLVELVDAVGGVRQRLPVETLRPVAPPGHTALVDLYAAIPIRMVAHAYVYLS